MGVFNANRLLNLLGVPLGIPQFSLILLQIKGILFVRIVEIFSFSNHRTFHSKVSSSFSFKILLTAFVQKDATATNRGASQYPNQRNQKRSW